MSVSYFVWYEGTVKDAEEFIAFYQREHAPILMGLPGIREIILHRSIGAKDVFPTIPGKAFLLVQMVFCTSSDLHAALRSPARALARAHFGVFPAFVGHIYHTAVESIEVFST